MKRTWIAAAVIALVGASGLAPAHATSIGNEGCTPGYWKNHTDNWFEAGPYSLIPSDTLLNSSRVGFATHFPEASLHDALGFHGGNTVLDKERILLRAAAAAWLNAAHEGLGYPLRRAGADGLVAQVNAAIASGDPSQILALATELDDLNNLGCPLS